MSLAHGTIPVPGALLQAWSPAPTLAVGLGLTGILYGAGVRRLWRVAGRGAGVAVAEAHAFYAGLAVLAAALLSPLDTLGAALFSAHMVQHLLLMLIAAPLIVIGRPTLPFLWLAPRDWRASALRWAHRRARLSALQAVLGAGVAVWLLHAAVLWAWHAPALYDAALRSRLVHDVEHASFLGSALLFWWVVVRWASRGRRGHGAGILYLFTAGLQGGALGALIAFSPRVLYPLQTVGSEAWGLQPLQDQQLAGLLMWIPMGLVYLIAVTFLVPGLLRPSGRGLAAPRPARHGRRSASLTLGVVALASVLLGLTGCGRHDPPDRMGEGEAAEGRRLILAYGCGSCHRIPGVEGADSPFAPPLDGFAGRLYVGGVAPNTPENLVQWLQEPRSLAPGTAMPSLGLSEEEARHIASYLYTLRP